MGLWRSHPPLAATRSEFYSHPLPGMRSVSMSVMKTYHLVPEESGWKLTLDGFEDPIELYPDQSRIEALGAAVAVVKISEEPATLRVHRQDGSFEEERTFPRSAQEVSPHTDLPEPPTLFT